MIVRTEAVVLKWKRYGDTSKIVTLLTEDYGRVAVIAKGARVPGRRYGPELDSLNHVQVVFYLKETRDLHLLSQCSLLRGFGALTTNLQRLGPAMSVLELASTSTPPGAECRDLFRALLMTLDAMNERDVNTASVLLHFEVRLLEILGFKPDLFHCRFCGKVLDCGDGTNRPVFRLTPHGVFCERCGDGKVIQGDSLSLLGRLQEIPGAAEAGQVSVDGDAGVEARKIVWYLLENHVGDFRRLKSETVFAGL